MRSRRWFCASAVGIVAIARGFALGQGKGHGKGHEKDRDDDRDDRGDYYQDRDREEMRHW